MTVTVITDSTCDLPTDLAQRRGIQVVPLYVMFGKETFQDGVTLNHQQFVQKLVSGGAHPSTSQPTPEDFLRVYRETPGEVFSVHISSGLSGTYNSAVQAVKLLDGDSARIRAHDSDSVTCGLGLIALAAQEAAAEGLDLDGVQARVKAVRESLKVLFTVETLEYLQKGGRIGKAQALMGGLLKIKPVLAFDNGSVSAIAKAFGFDQALAKIVALAAEDHARRPLKRMFVAHVAAPDSGARLERMVREKLGSDFEILTAEIGAVVGTHVGPGAVGLMYHS